MKEQKTTEIQCTTVDSASISFAGNPFNLFSEYLESVVVSCYPAKRDNLSSSSIETMSFLSVSVFIRQWSELTVVGEII